MSEDLDWDSSALGSMAEHADYHVIVTEPGSDPRPPVRPDVDPSPVAPPVITGGAW